MNFLKKLNEIDPYSLNEKDKQKLFSSSLIKLNQHHYKNCNEYKKIIKFLNYNIKNSQIEKMPYMPVTLFKKFNLSSIPKNKIIKTLVSSGTSGNEVSKIFLDKENASNQTKILSKLFSKITNNKRLPMLVVDSKNILKDRNLFSARGAAILGFSMFGKDITYALNDDLKLNIKTLNYFLKKYKDQKILIFGFTYLLWEYFLKEINKKEQNINLTNAIIVHGGGWKKLSDKSISNHQFKNYFKKYGAEQVINYYGMVEQTGSIFFECNKGYLHTSIYSDVIIRNNDLSVSKLKQEGIVQLISLLPTSYPGHIILTHDKGKLIGVDNCQCGKLGKYFLISGRLKASELRGCSDTH